MINENLSVVTVNFNNVSGLRRTLESLSKVLIKPKEIIIIDALRKILSPDDCILFQKLL